MAHILMDEGDLGEALAIVLLALNHPLSRIESKARAEGICTKLTALLTLQQVEAAHAWKNEKALHEVISEIVQTGRIHIQLDSSDPSRSPTGRFVDLT
jgi:hypothetical protein